MGTPIKISDDEQYKKNCENLTIGQTIKELRRVQKAYDPEKWKTHVLEQLERRANWLTNKIILMAEKGKL